MSKYKIEIKWALISFLFVLGWMAMERLIGLHDKYIHLHESLTILALIPSLMITYLFYNDKKSNFYKRNMTFKQGLEAGFSNTFFNLLLTPIFQWITTRFITPDYFQNAINYIVARREMSLDEAQLFFNESNYIIQAMFGTVVIGILSTLIFSFFMQSKK
jgi:Protein of unknown function (DUF4199)